MWDAMNHRASRTDLSVARKRAWIGITPGPSVGIVPVVIVVVAPMAQQSRGGLKTLCWRGRFGGATLLRSLRWLGRVSLLCEVAGTSWSRCADFAPAPTSPSAVLFGAGAKSAQRDLRQRRLAEERIFSHLGSLAGGMGA